MLSAIPLALVPRYLGTERYGWLVVAISLWSIPAVVAAFGTTTLVTLDVARNPTKVEMGPIIGLRALCFTLASIALAAFIAVADYGSDIIRVTAVLGMVTLVRCFAEADAAALAGLERMDLLAVSDIAQKVVITGASVAAVIYWRSPEAVAIAQLLGVIVYAAAIGHSLRRAVRVDMSISRSAIITAARRASPYLLIGVVLVAYASIDVIIMSFLLDGEELGWYGAADFLYTSFAFLPAILARALQPAAARRHVDDPNSAQTLLAVALRSLIVIAVPIGLGVALTAHQVTNLLYGDAYDGAASVLVVLGFVLMLNYFTTVLGQHAVSIGRQRLWTMLLLIALLLTIPLDLVLVPLMRDHYQNGAIAGALSYIVTEGMMLVIGLYTLGRHIVDRATGVRCIKVVVAGGVMSAVCWPLRSLPLPVVIAAGIGSYVSMAWALRILEDYELELAQRVTARLRRMVRA